MYSTLLKEALKVGIKKHVFDRFILYNPDTYDSLLGQARINYKVAIGQYKNVINASSKRY